MGRESNLGRDLLIASLEPLYGTLNGDVMC